MKFESVYDEEFLENAKCWIREKGEVLVFIRFGFGAADHEYLIVNSFDKYLFLLNILPSRTDVTVFKHKQLPIRGIVNHDFVIKCLDDISEKTEWLIITYNHIFVSKNKLVDSLNKIREAHKFFANFNNDYKSNQSVVVKEQIDLFWFKMKLWPSIELYNEFKGIATKPIETENLEIHKYLEMASKYFFSNPEREQFFGEGTKELRGMVSKLWGKYILFGKIPEWWNPDNNLMQSGYVPLPDGTVFPGVY